MYSTFDLRADDCTRLVAWRNQTRTGPRVLVCNGMGVPPEAWPRLIADDCRYEVAGWNQRGVLGSDRPEDPDRIDIADHVADAVALLDALGWSDAIVVAWSLGVNVAFELADAHPERVAGVLSVAGVPGGTFDTILAPQLVPRPLRRPLGLGIVHTGRLMGQPLNLFARLLPKGRPLAELMRFSGIVLPMADVRDVQPWLRAFFSQDWDWYFRLAVALERHGRIDPTFIAVPVTIIAGLFDAFTSHDDVVAYARQIRHAEVHSLPGSHCMPLEFPDRIMDLLDELERRVQGHRAGRTYLARWADGSAESAGSSVVESDSARGRGIVATLIDLRVPVADLREPRSDAQPSSIPWWASAAPPP